MTPTELKLQAIVADRLKIAPASVPLDAAITDDLGLDSFDLMNLIIDIEHAFAPLTLSDEAAQDLKTLREVAKYIDNRQNLPPLP